MRKQVLAASTALAIAGAMTTGAMALDHKPGRHHVSRVHAGEMHGARVRHDNRFARVRGFDSPGPGAWEGDSPRGGFISLGPLGITAACGSYRYQRGYCGQGYSVSAWSR